MGDHRFLYAQILVLKHDLNSISFLYHHHHHQRLTSVAPTSHKREM